ncbi:integrase core domain protein, partial [Acinetobacter sp. 259052]
LLTNDCTQSMSRRGNCWDNAVTESFFHTLKGHVVHGSVFAT